MLGRKVERREDMPVVLDLGTLGHRIAQPREYLDDLVGHQRNGMTRTQLLRRTGTAHVGNPLRGVPGGVRKLPPQGVDPPLRPVLKVAELLAELPFQLRRHALELLHKGRQLAFFPQHPDSEILDLGRSFGFECLHPFEQLVDFIVHNLKFTLYFVLLRTV